MTDARAGACRGKRWNRQEMGEAVRRRVAAVSPDGPPRFAHLKQDVPNVRARCPHERFVLDDVGFTSGLVRGLALFRLARGLRERLDALPAGDSLQLRRR